MNLISISDLSKGDICRILDRADDFKSQRGQAGAEASPLAGKIITKTLSLSHQLTPVK